MRPLAFLRVGINSYKYTADPEAPAYFLGSIIPSRDPMRRMSNCTSLPGKLALAASKMGADHENSA
jgi:hypothetical protein